MLRKGGAYILLVDPDPFKWNQNLAHRWRAGIMATLGSGSTLSDIA